MSERTLLDAIAEDVERARERQDKAISEAGARAEEIIREDRAVSDERPSKALTILGTLAVLVGLATIASDLINVVSVLEATGLSLTHIAKALNPDAAGQELALRVAAAAFSVLLTVQLVVLGFRLTGNRRRGAARQSRLMVCTSLVVLILDVMSKGVGTQVAVDTGVTVFLITLSILADPSLAQERAVQRRLRAMDERERLAEGTLGRDVTGEGYLELNFFNVFWMFFIASIAGLLFESMVCPIINGGVFQNRTGVLWGPFSPIYGVGAVLMVVALNRFYDKSPWIIFAVSALIGGAFEFLASWFFQFAFGILAWDYSGEFMNFCGRTDLFHMACWGILGLWFIKRVVPFVLKLTNRIPWNWRYAVTTVFAAFMLVNAAMTLMSFDFWYQREAGIAPQTPVAEFFAENYGDDFMSDHFQTMNLDPSRATR